MANSDISNIIFPIDDKILSSINMNVSNLSREQLAWISGYYWGKATGSNINDNCISNINPELSSDIITIVSGSQTGNAHKLAAVIFNKLHANNFNVRLINICDYSFKKLSKEKYFILIISTQGEGEPPEEAIPFYNSLMSKKVDRLDHLYFSIFGLGDSSYNFFCKTGKDFDSRLNELGAQRFLDRIDADVDYSGISDEWCAKLVSFFQNKSVNIIVNNNKLSDFIDKKSQSILHKECTKENPFYGTLLVNQKITGRNSIKDIRHIEIGICNSKVNYKPGDALGVWYENSKELVLNILDIFNIDKHEDVSILHNKTVNIFIALTKYYEITVNTINLVQRYAKLSNHDFLVNLVSDSKKMLGYIKNTPIHYMFSVFPTKLTSIQLLSLLRPLTPRLYSISSSQLEYSDEVHITVGVVQYAVSNQIYQGGASSYLSYRVEEDSKIGIFIQSNDNFRLPKDDNISIIMIGAGTGIAPFRAFIQERKCLSARGKNWIFYGNQTFSEDFLYQREWQSYFDMGLLTNIDLAWSRDSKEKVYVQHKIWNKGQEVWNWINNGAYIYVCGDKTNMAKDVESILLKIILKYGSMNIDQGNEYIDNLRINHRYQRDVY